MTRIEIATQLLAAWSHGELPCKEHLLMDALDIAQDLINEDHRRRARTMDFLEKENERRAQAAVDDSESKAGTEAPLTPPK
jgi:hypothetical protein